MSASPTPWPVPEAALTHELPLISVIIPVYNDVERLRLCLQALKDQTYPPNRYEIIIVDNGSEVDISSVAANLSAARVFREPKRSSYAARNRGLAEACGYVIAFTDSDCIPASNWLEKGTARLFSTPGCGLVGGQVDVFVRDPRRPTAVELHEVFAAFPQRSYIERAHFGATANVFTTRAVIDHVGPFDDTLESGGDREWGNRVFAAGYSVVYADDVVVRHPARRTFGEMRRRAARVIGGDFRLQTRQGQRRQVLLDALRELLPNFRQMIRIYRLNEPRSLWQKTQMIAVDLFWRYARSIERFRLLVSTRRR